MGASPGLEAEHRQAPPVGFCSYARRTGFCGVRPQARGWRRHRFLMSANVRVSKSGADLPTVLHMESARLIADMPNPGMSAPPTGLPEAGDLRSVSPDATSSDFHSRQHCGRLSQAEQGGQAAIHEYGRRLQYYLILAQDLCYGQTETLISSLEELSRLLNAYAGAILTSSS